MQRVFWCHWYLARLAIKALRISSKDQTWQADVFAITQNVITQKRRFGESPIASRNPCLDFPAARCSTPNAQGKQAFLFLADLTGNAS